MHDISVKCVRRKKCIEGIMFHCLKLEISAQEIGIADVRKITTINGSKPFRALY